MKECPYCARPLEDAAVVCKRCKSPLTNGAEQAETAQGKATAGPVWPWDWLAATLLAGMLIVYGYCVQRVMH